MNTILKISVENFTRYSLGVLLAFVALNALGGGYYGMAGARDVPIEWLSGSPFHNYFIPGLFLFAVIGGTAIFSSVTVFLKLRIAKTAVIICGILLLTWIAVQVSIIGYVSWMQPATVIVAVTLLLLNWQLSRPTKQ